MAIESLPQPSIPITTPLRPRLGFLTATPIIAVNGGPGLSHVYMIQNDVWTRRIAEHRQVIFYDQRGTGASRLRPGAENED